MKQLKIPAVFMRGGTSNAVVFNAKDLPRDRALWDEIFLAAIGSPDSLAGSPAVSAAFAVYRAITVAPSPVRV